MVFENEKVENEEIENEEVKNEEIKNEKDVVNHSSVSVNPQPSSADVVTHPVTIHNDGDDVIQQSSSPAPALKSGHYPLWS